MTGYCVFSELANTLFKLESAFFEDDKIKEARSLLMNVIKAFNSEFCNLSKNNNDLTPILLSRHLRRFFSKYHFRIPRLASVATFTLTEVLQTRYGSCLGLTTLFSVINQIKEFPTMVSLFEGHIAPCYQKKGSTYYIETTRNFRIVSEEFMSVNYGGYIKRLSYTEFIAVHLSNHATKLCQKTDGQDIARNLIDSALTLFEDYAAGWINRAIIMKKCGNISESVVSLEKARKLCLGNLYCQAIKDIENKLYPSFKQKGFFHE